MIPLVVILVASIPITWLLILRPYSIRHGEGYTPGAVAWVTMSVDWQQAKEISKRKGHKRILPLCNLFIWIQVALISVIVFEIAMPYIGSKP
ncbi:hypothetical protein JIN85_04380 [Luteolibacter pohnpeiensis]|uniref:Uncharacterized protein n=1 Tax=Luteolibacter pohnpeiensis TaxID=454153 RepID=A0A934S378_9BACT|nr:hypothetical protein [Luteolibacter pohnpeiensis]MBK1881636.1 hypothetical protein [Luteolibacter pohnpeiensis]